MREENWWRGAVIYQVYPRSFRDSNGDGIGDLVGITQKLDYIADLGVDGIWLSPVFRSPMDDFGYDVCDYRAIDPIFGSIEDFDALLERAHSLGLKVLLDQVLSHTSNQHPWFIESRASRDNPRADWYVWADPRPDGTPPTNWLSIFGGVAWQWEPRRQQYYLHNFLASQPDLNFHCAEVRRQLLEEVEFWLERGVDGFRLDVVNFYFHDVLLRDNPPRPPAERFAQGFSPNNPYAFQLHHYDKTQPENLDFLRELRRLMDRYPRKMLVGEIGDDDSLATMASYTSGNDKLHTAYCFELLGPTFSAAFIRQSVERLEGMIGDGWPSWAFTNHDVARVIGRWGDADAPPELARVLLALLFSLRGDVCLFQGEELGLPQAEIAWEDLRDPFGIAFWPEFKGRDGCRTPMPWDAEAPNLGFSGARPWLPVAESHRRLAVSLQRDDPNSVLNQCREILAWRRRQPALRRGDIRFFDSPGESLVFSRRHPGQNLIACFNLDASPVTIELPDLGAINPFDDAGFGAELEANRVKLAPYGAFFGETGSQATGPA